MSKCCIICRNKSTGHFAAQVFDKSGSLKELTVCRQHDIELFKMGQIRFMAKYRVNLTEIASSDATGLDELLEDAA